MLQGEAKALYTSRRSSGVDLSDPALTEAWAKVRSDESAEDWCAFTYSGSSSTVLALLGCGCGGVAELCSSLSENIVAFCGLRVLIGGRPRFFRVAFVGEHVGGMKKGKAALHKNAAFNILEGASGGDHSFGSIPEFLAGAQAFS
ncbi:unnamed protein product [Discosporangium mesarthrocarpum]